MFMKTFKEKIIEHYHLTNEEVKELTKPLSEVSLLDPTKINGMDKTTSRIFKAINNKEKIIIYGDYDCDGISATTIMVKTFEKLNYPVSYYIPSRYLDGYGLNVVNVEKIAKKGYKLIICVDNGISANEAIDKANEYGIDVIVIDHHEVPKEMVNAYSIIHPTVSHISDIIGSGGYMSLFVSAALLNKYDDYLVTIAGLSTISDLMELKGYNRDVVRLAIDNLNKHHYLALSLLLDTHVITEKSFGLEIAPKINAIGRINEDTSVNKVVKYLISEDEHEIYALSEWILKINDIRKDLTKEIADSLPAIENEYGICVNLEIKEGLIGLLANRLMGQYKVPSIVFTSDKKDPDILKGSIRSKEGFNVVKAFESLNKYLLSGGGHAFAGGLSINKMEFDNFKLDFLELAKAHRFVEENIEAIEISLIDINITNYKTLREFAPFGMGFNEPSFIVNNIPTKNLTFISNGKHLSTKLSLNSKLLGFNMPQEEIKSNSSINLYGQFYLSEYKGFETLDFRINKYAI